MRISLYFGFVLAAVLPTMVVAQQAAPAATNPCESVTDYDTVQQTRPPMVVTTAVVTATDETVNGPDAINNRPKRQLPVLTGPMLKYVPVEGPKPPSGTVFGQVASVALLSDGHLLVFQRQRENELLEYDQDNRLLRTFDENIADRPHSVRVDKDDNIWISDITCNVVMKLSRNGNVLMTLGTRGKAGTWNEAKGDHLFDHVSDTAVGPDGDLYVVTGHGGPDPRVDKFDKNGKFLLTWSLKHADGTRANIHTVVVDKNNQVYIGDREAQLIREYTADGKHIRDMHEPTLVCGLFIDAKGGLWMAGGHDAKLMKLDWNGKVLAWTGQSGRGPNEYGEAHYLVVTPDMKTIYVAETNGSRVDRLDATN